MKRLLEIIGFMLSRLSKLFGNILSMFIRLRLPVKKRRVMFWAYNFKQYSCNPRYVSDYLLENYPQYEIYWVFRKNIDTSSIDKRIKCIKLYSWQYFLLVNSAEFLITNARTDPYQIYWHKRAGQKYIMLWHGGIALKKIERDVEKVLGFSYLQKAKKDSKVCNVMVSGCTMQTNLIKEKFWYSGEVLEKGIPRNDIFFNLDLHSKIREKVYSYYNIPKQNRILLYAPTFRRNGSIEPYKIEWGRVITYVKKMLNSSDITVLLRLHPNLINKVDTTPLLNSPEVIDVTKYHDMQELLCISDILITDYSSSMFDFAMLNRPCILYATDAEKYDRGYYFSLSELPFPMAHNQDELVSIIDSFDNNQYQQSLNHFFRDTVGLFEDGQASKALCEWIVSHSIQ